MTPEERFERIEANLQQSAALLVELHKAMQGVINIQGGFATAISQYGEAAEQRAMAVDKSIEQLNQSIANYVASADARAKILEESMDKLLRAITAEHSNGKGKH